MNAQKVTPSQLRARLAWLLEPSGICACGHARKDHYGSCGFNFRQSRPSLGAVPLCNCWKYTEHFDLYRSDVALGLYSAVHAEITTTRVEPTTRRNAVLWRCACGAVFPREKVNLTGVNTAHLGSATYYAAPTVDRYAQAHLSTCPVWSRFDEAASLFFGVTAETLPVVLDLALERLAGEVAA